MEALRPSGSAEDFAEVIEDREPEDDEEVCNVSDHDVVVNVVCRLWNR